MKTRGEPEPVPAERSRTIRRDIIDRLQDGPVSVSELSAEIGLSENQINDHLESLRRQVELVIEPARCAQCGFEFKERRRTGKPGKCPACRGTRIEPPLFSVANG